MRIPQQKKHTTNTHTYTTEPYQTAAYTHIWRLRPSIIDYYEYHYIQALAPS